MSDPKYKRIEVPLSGEDGNSFFIIGRVTKAMKRGGINASETKAFTEEAMSGDYQNLLRTVMKWVSTT